MRPRPAWLLVCVLLSSACDDDARDGELARDVDPALDVESAQGVEPAQEVRAPIATEPEELGPYLVPAEEGGFSVVAARPREGPAIALGTRETREARTSLMFWFVEGAVRFTPPGGEPRAAPPDALDPLFEGADAWATPVQARVSAPPETPHAQVVALLDALRAHGIERVALVAEPSGDP